MSDREDTPPDRLIAERRLRLGRIVQRPLTPPSDVPTPPDRFDHLVQQAEELYWNELAWERLTGEESRGGSRLVEFMFPGLLAFVDGLLLEEVNPDARALASPRPGVVEAILRFLAVRRIHSMDGDGEAARAERLVTDRLIDLVLYRLHRLPVERVERLDTAELDGD